VHRIVGRPRERGQALVELALIAPIFLLLVLGAIEFGAAFQARITLTNAAREGARLAGRGNIFTTAQILQVVQGQSPSVDIAAHGSVLVTTARCVTGCTFTTSRLSGAAASRLTLSTLQTMQQQLTSSEPAYLGREEFVVLEIIYVHPTFSGVFGATFPMYIAVAMPVSAPS
jgi:Flp pilus assembly protein TadG